MHARTSLLSQLRRARQEIQRALVFYQDLEHTMPESNLWEMHKRNPLMPNPAGILSDNLQVPSITLRVAAEAIDDYVQAIESFTNEQWAAFSLGLSAAWLPLGLICRQLIAEQIQRVERSLADERSREEKISTEEAQRFRKDDPLLSGLPFASVKQRMPSQILGEYLCLLREQELALGTVPRA